MHDDLFFREVLLGPRVGIDVLAQLRLQNHRPQRLPRSEDDRRRGGVGAHAAIPAAQQIRRLLEPCIGGSGAIDRVSEAMRKLLIHLAIHIGLDGEHVLAGQLFAATQVHVNPLRAIGVNPFQRDWELGVVGRDARVSGGQNA